MKYTRLITYFLALAIPAAAYAEHTGVVPSPELVKDNPQLFQWVLGVAILVSLYLLHQVVDTHKETSKKQWECLDDHGKQIAEVKKDVARIDQRCDDHEKYGGPERRKTPRG